MKMFLVFAAILLGLGIFTYLNWGGTGCTDIPGVSYNDLQACISRTKLYSDYNALPEAAREPSKQRVSFQSIGSECRLYIAIDTVVENAVQKWTDYCVVTKPNAFKECVEQAASPDKAACSEFLVR